MRGASRSLFTQTSAEAFISPAPTAGSVTSRVSGHGVEDGGTLQGARMGGGGWGGVTGRHRETEL